MEKLITVRVMGKKETKQVTLEEAKKIMEQVLDDPIGGLVANAKTRQVIWKLEPGVDEILIMEKMFGGG